MIFVLTSLLALTAAGVFSSHVLPARADPPRGSERARISLVAFSVLAIVGSFGAWIVTIAAAAHAPEGAPNPDWFASLPLLVIDDRAPLFGHAPYGTVVGVISIVQTGALITLFLALRDRRTGTINRRIVVGAFAVMAVMALTSRCVTSFDLYAYAGAVHRGIAGAYHPSFVPFTGDWALLNRIYGNPIVPIPYGPVWLAVSYLASGWAPSLGSALTMLRLLELAAYVACIFSLRALRLPPATLAVFALNPALFENFVIDGHNDLLGVSLVLVAAALRPRLPFLAIAAAGAAGAIKLPLLIVAPLAFAGEVHLRRRILASIAAFFVGIAISLACDGNGYLAAIRTTAGIFQTTLSDPVVNLTRSAVALFVAVLVSAAVFRRRFVPTASWAFSALAASIFSWYLAWGIPYAAAERRWIGAFAISLPWLQFVTATTFSQSSFRILAFYLTLVLGPTIAALSLRNARPIHR